MEKKEVLNSTDIYMNGKLLDIPSILNITIDTLKDTQKLIKILSTISTEKSLKGIKDPFLDQALLLGHSIAANPILKDTYINAYLKELKPEEFFSPNHRIVNFFGSFHIPKDFTTEQLESAFQRIKDVIKQNYAKTLFTIERNRKELENNNDLEEKEKQLKIKELQQNLELAQKKYRLNDQLLNNGYSILTDSLRKKGYMDILNNPQILETIQSKNPRRETENVSQNNSTSYTPSNKAIVDQKDTPEIEKPKLKIYQEKRNNQTETKPFLNPSSFQKQIEILIDEQLCQLYRQTRKEKTEIEEKLIPNLASLNRTIKETKGQPIEEQFLDIKKTLLAQNQKILENHPSYQRVLLQLEIMENELNKRRIRIVAKKKKGKAIEPDKKNLPTKKAETKTTNQAIGTIISDKIIPIERKRKELKEKRFGLLKFKKEIEFTPIWQTASFQKQLEHLDDKQLYQLQWQTLKKKEEIEERLIPNLDAINHAIEELKLKMNIPGSQKAQEHKNNYQLLSAIRDSLFSQNQGRLNNSSIYKEILEQLELIQKELNKRPEKRNEQSKKAL